MTRKEGSGTQANTWNMLCHLTSLAEFIGIPFGNVIRPLGICLIKKNEFLRVDEHGKESLNSQISMTIYGVIAFVLCFVFIDFILVPVIVIADLFWSSSPVLKRTAA